jgi:hypothetical protein
MSSHRSELLREVAADFGEGAREWMIDVRGRPRAYVAEGPNIAKRCARRAFSLAMMALEEEGCKCRLVERGLFLLCPKHVSKEEVDYYLEHAPVDYYLEHAPTGSDFS